jgi:redox-sensitive bicupin YhaK (pirin superfamily)
MTDTTPMTVAPTAQPHDKDLGGGFKVRRLLPAAQRRSVGPFVFFDHFGPATEKPGTEHDVRPHPHIGLATVTYLFEGAMMHRDSLGSVQEILPGAINWMTSGRGIVHSERKPERLKADTYVNHGLQLWAALPQAHEEVEPSFEHTAASAIPEVVEQGAHVRVLVGEAFGQRSPVKTLAQTVYLDIALPAGGRFELPALAPELAIYAVDADARVNGEAIPAHTMAVLPDGQGAVLTAARRAPDGDRRRAARRPALHHLELRLEPARAHPRSRRRLGRTAHGPRARRDRIHSAAGQALRRARAGYGHHARLISRSGALSQGA